MADKKLAHLFGKPVYFDPPDNLDDVIVEGSDSELNVGAMRQKRKDIELTAQQYLQGRVPVLVSAQLKGPFTEGGGWQNPWKKEPRARRHQQDKPNASPKKLQEAEEEDVTYLGTRRKLREKRNTRPKKVQDAEEGIRDRGHHIRQRRGGFDADTESDDEASRVSDRLSRPGKSGRDFSLNSTSQTAQQPRAFTKPTTKPLLRTDMPPPAQSNDMRKAGTLPGGNEEWLKRKVAPNKSLWEAPPGSTPTPTPTTVATVPSNKRKRRAPIVRTQSDRSARSSAEEPSPNQTANENGWQHAQLPRTSSFGSSNDSMGNSQRHSFASATKVPPRSLPFENPTPVRNRNVINTIVTASTGKRMSLADRQSSFFEGSFDTHGVIEDSSQRQRDRSPSWDEHRPASSDRDITRSSINNRFAKRSSTGHATRSFERSSEDRRYKGRERPGGVTSTSQEIDRKSPNEESLFGLYQAAQLSRSAAATPLSAQIGSLDKYQLSLPRFNFDNSQSQKAAGSNFAFSFNVGASSHVQPSIEPASRPLSAHSQSGQTELGLEELDNLQDKRKSSSYKCLSAKAVPPSRFTDQSFHFSKAERGNRVVAQKDIREPTRESRQHRDDVAEDIPGNGVSVPEVGRLRRSMTFEEDDSPGFNGPKQKRHREKTKLKRTQTTERRESSASSKSVQRFAIQVGARPLSEVASDPKQNCEKAAEASKPTLSTFMTVNTTEDPSTSESLTKPGEGVPTLDQEVAKHPYPSPKLVISAIIAEHISPVKPTSSPPAPAVTNPMLESTDLSLPAQDSGLDLPSNITNVDSPASRLKSQSPLKGLSPPHASESDESSSDDEELTSRSTKSPSVDKPRLSEDPAQVSVEEAPQMSHSDKMPQSVIEDDNAAQEELAASATLNLASLFGSSPMKYNSAQRPSLERDEDLVSQPDSPPRNSTDWQPQPTSPAQNSQSPFRKEAAEASLEHVLPPEDGHAHQDTQSSWSFNDTTLSDFSRADSPAYLVTTPKARISMGRSALSRVKSNASIEEAEEPSLPLHKPTPSSPVQASPVEIGSVPEEKLKAKTEEASDQPGIGVEDIVISSDDEEEDIPNDKPAQIMALRNSFLSPIRKKRRPSKLARKSPRKPLYRPYGSSSGPPTPERPAAKVTEEQRLTTNTPIQAVNGDSTAEQVGPRFGSNAEQSPWVDEKALTSNLSLPLLKTPVNNLDEGISNSEIQSFSINSRIASQLQTGWDESVFENVHNYAPVNGPEEDVDFEIHQEHSSPLADFEHPEEATTQSIELSELRPFRTFATPSPPRHRKIPLESQDEFPNTQALVDVVMNNPWASIKPAPKKRVSFAPSVSSDDEDDLPVMERKSGKRRRLISPPPASDDSVGIDGPEDKFARQLRAAKTLKLADNLSSSPRADAGARRFVEADTQTYHATRSTSNGKRKSRGIDDDNSAVNGMSTPRPRPSKRQYRPSQTWEDEEEDELETGSSFEITPNGQITPVKNRTATRDAYKKTPKSSLTKANTGEAKQDIAALVENNPDELIEDVSNFFQGWNVDEELRRVNGRA